MKKNLYLAIMIVALSLQAGCLYVVRYDGPYEGKVVDQESQEPIEGAVVLGTWHTIQPSMGGGVSYYSDARETVTDVNGNFTIRGQGLRIMSNLEPMGVLIFKSGYSYEQIGSWDTLKTGIYSKERIKWEGDKPIFPLKKLTLDERKDGPLPPYPPSESKRADKTNLFMQEIKKERREQGLEVTD